MGGQKPFALWCLALVAGLGGSTSLPAQCRLCDQPATARSGLGDSEGLTLDVETNLNFDRLILTGAGNAAAVVRPDGLNSFEGSVAGVSARAMVGTASIHGTPLRLVRVEMPARIQLYSPAGGRISVDELVTDLPSLPKLDSAGNLSFRFGGRVSITGDSEGNYRGEIPITVEYQ